MEWISVKKSLPKESGNYLVNVHQEDEYRAGDIVLEAWYHADEGVYYPLDAVARTAKDGR